jgi:hypothetical protein
MIKKPNTIGQPADWLSRKEKIVEKVLKLKALSTKKHLDLWNNKPLKKSGQCN